MKRIFYLAIIVCVLFSACSKGTQYGTPTPAPKYVTIGGTNYKIVQINGQTWTAINYNGSGGENYGNGANDTTMGKLYTAAEVQAIILPAGWRLPTEADFNNLNAAIGGSLQSDGTYLVSGNESLGLTSTTRWSTSNGSNSLGFNAYPAGVYNQVAVNNQQFNGQGTEAVFLSSTPYASGAAYPACYVITATTAAFSNPVILPTDRASVRFVMGN
jgi:uncharacterized protein (TIGR02145 family)